MCNLAIAIQRTPGNAEVRKLLAGQYSKMATQPDGICALTVGENQRVSVERKLKKDEYPLVFTKAMDGLKDNRLVAVHTRIASVGNVSDENVHFFRYGSRYFAHNGHVGEFMSRKLGMGKHTPRFDGKQASGNSGRKWVISGKKLGKAMRSKSDVVLFVERATVEERLSRLSDAVDQCLDCDKGHTCHNHRGTTDEVLALETLLSSGRIQNIHMIPDEDRAGSHDMPDMGPMFDSGKGNLDTGTGQLFQDTEGRLAVGAERNLDPSDSLQFLQAMPKELDILALHEFADDKKFSGVGLLVDEDMKKAWIMSTRQCDVHTDGNGYLIVYSFLPNKDYAEWQSVMGVPIVKAEDKKYPTATLPAGIYEVDLCALETGQDDILSECM